jgi:uncharacterized lipoprotein YehR (DUF1307 family)
MTIINFNQQFFWTKIQKNLLFLLIILQLSACVKKEKFQIENIKTATGWGYTITYKNRILIKQTIIPVVDHNKSFATKEDAQKVAALVVSKLNDNRSPSVTKNDLILLKIKI